MTYLENHLPWKEDPPSKYPFARSVFCFAIPYRPHPEPADNLPFSHLRVATYAQGKDYHHWMKERLEKIATALHEMFPEHQFETHTDSSPLLERDLAFQSGLGWVGKNTCLINRQEGSFFLLGEIISSLQPPAASAKTTPDFCGTCTRCIDICPTQALKSPRTIDARKCISYLSIESRDLPAEDLRTSWGDWFFGCDLCQSVCPWNAKPFKIDVSEKEHLLPETPTEREGIIRDLSWILTSSGKTLEKAFTGTAFRRAGSFGLKRNAVIVATNRGLHELIPQIKSLQEHPKLSPLVEWSLDRLKSLP